MWTVLYISLLNAACLYCSELWAQLAGDQPYAADLLRPCLIALSIGHAVMAVTATRRYCIPEKDGGGVINVWWPSTLHACALALFSPVQVALLLLPQTSDLSDQISRLLHSYSVPALLALTGYLHQRREAGRLRIAAMAYAKEQEHGQSQLQKRQQRERIMLTELQEEVARCEREVGHLEGHGLEELGVQELDALETKLLDAMRRVQGARREAQQAEKEEESHRYLCKICLDRPMQVALLPCGHHCLCSSCSLQITTCPICRTEVERRQQLFLA